MAFVVTYTYSFDDYLALVRARRAMGIFGGLGGVVHYVLAVIAFLLVLAALRDWRTMSFADVFTTGSLALIIGGAVFICFVIAAIDQFFERVLYRLLFRRYAIANSELSITVDDESIRWSAKGVSGNIGWPLTKRLYLARDHVFVFISKVEGLVLPRRGVAPPATFDELVSFLRARVAAAGAAVAVAGATA